MKFLKYIIIFLISIMYSQYGKNIVQYHTFNWHYIQTEYFDIYYYDTNINAQYVAEESDKAYDVISNAIGWNLKNRVPIIVYNSHNDFQQTNVIDMYMPEGVGGVTELYKNRVVIPYDGSKQQFRDVIHHELVHAFINDYLYKGNIMNMQESSIEPIPLWMNEGLAEFLASSWSTESDMWIRDIVINGETLPTFNQLNGYLAYRGGQSIWKFIVEKLDSAYLNNETTSPTIIASIFKAITSSTDLNSALEKSIDMDMQELEDEWHKYLKEEYWSDIENRDYIKDIASPLMNHKKINGNYTIAPAVSPDGSRIAFYSNKDGVMSLYAGDSTCEKCDPKLFKKFVKGEMSTVFEELHILKPGLSWSSDNKRLVFAAKSKGEDVLFIIDVDSKKKQRIPLKNYGIKAIFQPAWNPVKNHLIAFIGCNNHQSDIYIYNIDTNQLENLTNSSFTDKDVAWSHNGEDLFFSSDKNKFQYDLYKLSLDSKTIFQLTNTEFNEHYPSPLGDRNSITFISDQSGINNLYILNIDDENSQNDSSITPISNIFTGVIQLTTNNNNIFFTGLENNKFMIYRLDSIDMKKISDIPQAKWKEKFQNYKYDSDYKQTITHDYSNYIFGRNNNSIEKDTIDTFDISETKDSLGSYIEHKYKTRFTMDIGRVFYGFGFNGYDYSGGSGFAQFVFSDILGDHKVYLGTEAQINFKRSDYFIGYRYLPHKIDWNFIFFHDAIERFTGDGFNEFYQSLYQRFTLAINASRPLSKFNRLDLGFEYAYWTKHNEIWTVQNNRYDIESSEFEYDKHKPMIELKYVWDNTRFAYTYPNDGSRFYIKYKTGSFASYNANSITFDGRLYKPFSNGLSIMLRNFTGFGWGKDHAKFHIGGMPSFYTSDNFDVSRYYSSFNLDELSFSEHVMPVRGVPFMYKNGDHAMLFNFEVRAPFLLYYFPAIKWVGQINAIAFIDLGVTWDEQFPSIFNQDSWIERSSDPNSEVGVQGWVMTYGWGPRFILLGMPMQINYAWEYNPITKKKSDRRWEFTLGVDL